MRRLMEWLYRTFLGLETRPAGDLHALEAERETLLAGREAIEQALIINRDRIDAIVERQAPPDYIVQTNQNAPAGFYAARATKIHCNYPHCDCPFDAPADPNWCARGLSHAQPAANGWAKP